MRERERQIEIEERYIRLSHEVKAYLSLTEAIAEVIPAQRDALQGEQNKYLHIITQNPELQVELANFVQLRNERRKATS